MADKLAGIREEARAKERRIEIALAAIDSLRPDEIAFVYVKLEKKLVGLTDNEPSETATSPTEARRLEIDPSKAPKYELKKRARYESATEIEALIHANPQGLRMYEISSALKLSSGSACVALNTLESAGRIQRHGIFRKTLWTPPGLVPAFRIETAEDAILHELAAGPRNGSQLANDAMELLQRMTGRHFGFGSLKTKICQLVTSKRIVHHGADENGAIYALSQEPEEGGDSESDSEEEPRTIN